MKSLKNKQAKEPAIDNKRISKFMRRNANLGYNNCPKCGEIRHIYVENNELKGISNGMFMEWHGGIFPMRTMRCDCYKCLTCGANWESEPYQWIEEG